VATNPPIGLIDAGTRTRYLDGMQRHSLDQLPSRDLDFDGLVCASRGQGLMPPLHGGSE